MPSERSERRGPVAGLLLAAGTASRMGRNKLLLPWDGETVLRHSARQALAGGVEPLVVVLGHQADLAARELAGLPHRVVVNPDYEQGMTTSLWAGLDALPTLAGGARAAAVLLADMPFVTAAMIEALLGRYAATAAPLVVSSYDGVDAPPMVYDRSLFAELQAMRGGDCGKRVVRRHRHEAEVLAWPAAALADLDRPEDYARLQSHLEAPG